MPTKAPPTRSTSDEPVLEDHHTVAEAAVRLNLRKKDDPSKRGEKWLRDGFNRPEDGSKGEPFPGRYMAGQLMFSDSDLAVISRISHEESLLRRQRSSVSTGRRRRVKRELATS